MKNSYRKMKKENGKVICQNNRRITRVRNNQLNLYANQRTIVTKKSNQQINRKK